MTKAKVIEDFERGFAPGGIPLEIDAHLRGISKSGTDTHYGRVMQGHCYGRYHASRERFQDRGRIEK